MLSKELHDLILTEEEKALRDGVFNLNTRRFGKVAEFMVARQFDYSFVKGETNYDLTDPNGLKVEVKFSRAAFTEEEMTFDNCRKICLDNANPTSRRIAYADFKEHGTGFDCNIQQIKAYLFDIMYYGIFFEDQIAVFSMTSPEMKNIMTAQYFLSDKKSPKPNIEKTATLAAKTKSEKQITESINKVRKKFQSILGTGNKYAEKAKDYLTSTSMMTPWDDMAIEIKESGWIPSPSEQSERLLEICAAYRDFCDRELAEKRLFPNISPFQHEGNDKAEGQMHLNSDNIQWHIEESGFFLGWLSYKELFDLLDPN